MTTAQGSTFDQIDRRMYDLSVERPFRVAAKQHLMPTVQRFDMHYALELGILLSGRMERLYRGHRRSLEPGEAWLCGSWEPHGFQVTQAPCEAVVVSIFPPMLTATSFPELGPVDWLAPFLVGAARRPEVPSCERPIVQGFARELVESLSLPESRRWLVQRMLVYQTLVTLPRVASIKADDADSYGCVNRAIELVFKHRRYVSSAEAAHHCALGRKAFCRLFTSVTGASFRLFAMRHRLQGAATQLRETHEPIKAIATEWGFVDASHFHVCFQAAFGCSPAHYRKAPSVPRAGETTS